MKASEPSCEVDFSLQTCLTLTRLRMWQWTSYEHPDHDCIQLRTLQTVLKRMLTGKVGDVSPGFGDRTMFTEDVVITTSEWKRLASEAYVWMDYLSVPQVRSRGE